MKLALSFSFLLFLSAGADAYDDTAVWRQHQRTIAWAAFDTNTVLHFARSQEQVANASFAYTVRVVEQEPDAMPLPEHPFSIEVNGRILYQTVGVPNTTLITVPLIYNVLRDGMNAINLMLGSPGGWLQFDFHRLSADTWEQPDRSGSLLYVQ